MSLWLMDRRVGDRWRDAATIVAAVAIGAIGLAAMLVLSRAPPSPPLGPARVAPARDAEGLRLRAAPDLPARIATEHRPVRRSHERRRARRPGLTVARPRAVAPPVVSAEPTPRAVTPAAPPPAPAPAAPARPTPRDTGQTFDSSG
jgi:hypothetical protein